MMCLFRCRYWFCWVGSSVSVEPSHSPPLSSSWAINGQVILVLGLINRHTTRSGTERALSLSHFSFRRCS